MNVKPDFSKNANQATTAPAFLSVWDMHAYYGESYIVQGISFNVHEGEILALLGRNGAGKTTTLRSIARLDNPEVRHGEIWLDHQPLHKMKSHEAATVGLGLVPEDRRIIPGLTVEENLQLAQIAPPIGWSLDRLYDLFPRLGERRKQEGVTLSGGEQQMLSIARALRLFGHRRVVRRLTQASSCANGTVSLPPPPPAVASAGPSAAPWPKCRTARFRGFGQGGARPRW